MNLGSNFTFNKTILIFWNKFAAKKESFYSKKEKMNVTIEYFILELV